MSATPPRRRLRPARHPAVRRSKLAVSIATVLSLVAVGLSQAPSAVQAATAPLRSHAAARGVLVGAAVDVPPLSNEAAYRDTLAREFNSVTPGNAMKWDATEPSRGQFSFGGADAVVDFAEANGQAVHGHTLVWHSQTPGWVQSLPADQMRAAMRDHIAAVVGRYRDRSSVGSWDVVNEALNEDGTLRSSFWRQTLGDGYIAEAFRAARAADPNAKLFINDYNVEGRNAKSTGLYNLVRDLRSQGVPIDGVGLQAHLILGQVPADVQENIARFAALGVEVRITELDVRIPMPADANELGQQASDYRRVVEACLAVSGCTGITVWGFTDKYSWIPDFFPGQGAALPFDESYNPKPAYDAMHDALAAGDGIEPLEGFVTASGDRFVVDGREFRYGGTNNYYLHYKSRLMVDDVFADAAAMDLGVMRTWTFLECGGDRPNSAGGCSQGPDLWMQRWSDAAGGPVYNDGPGGLERLDYMLAKANETGIRLIMVLTNNWPDFGGMDQYVTWHGGQFHDQFYTDPAIRQEYKDWVATLVNRVNSITGVRYRDDPAIFSWELANEPRCINASLPTSGTCTQDTLLDWADEMSTFVESLDPNHMVSVGDEGFLDWGRGEDWPYNAADGVDHEALTSLPNVDFGTFHLYPDHWGRDPAWGTTWITDHLAVAQDYGKPVILEEFGYRNQSARDATYQQWTDAVRNGGGDGWNFWLLTGIQDDGQLYPDYDGFRVVTPSTTATVLANAARAMATICPSDPPEPPDPLPGAEAYTWRNVEIAGGGFVPGIVFNQTEPGLVYARTDIGGAYRWDEAAKRWRALLDWVGWDDWGWSGVVSLATDPVDPDRLYVAAGTYTNDWDPNDGAILRSTDRGATWELTNLPFKLGGNMPGRGMGERLAVDPNDNSILYLGAPEGNGLWRSTDHGVTWSRVDSFPNPGNYAEDPGDASGYLSHRPGVVWVTFDERTGSDGQPTQTIYAGVADLQNTLYRSTDGGRSWDRVPGQPTGFLAHKGVLDPGAGYMYLATSDNGGPYGGTAGDVWRLDTDTGAWTRISPMPSDDSNGDNYFGYSGLSVDRQNPGTVMVTGYSSWWPDTLIWRSTDAGATWSPIWEWAGYPNRTLRYDQDISAVPWLTFGANPQPPEVTPKLGWMTEALEIDPHDPDRMLYGTGATIYGTTNLTAWDTGGTVAIEPMVAGLEETAVQDLVSPPSGAPLLSALGDIGGFRHADLGAVPPAMFQQPFFVTTTSLDYAEASPNYVVRVGDTDAAGVTHAGFSTNNGADWWQASSEPGGVTGGGTVAVAADGSRVVWSPQGAGVHVTGNDGASWTPSSGIPAGAVVESDRVNGNVFYGFSGGTFYVSSDGGASFQATGATGLPSASVKFQALPGHEGDIWLAGGSEGGTYGLWHSTDGGASFTRLANVQEADTVGFGAPAAGQDHPAVYTSAQIDDVRGIYRSDDAGETWVRINDDQRQWAWTGAAITGDPRVHGRVYVATNGRGIHYGDPA